MDGASETYHISGQIFLALVYRFTRGFQLDEPAPNVMIDMIGAHLWDISAVAALDKIVARLHRNGRTIKMIGYKRASADIVDWFALHDRTGFEIGVVLS